MGERLRINRVRVATAGEGVEITWKTRQELVRRLRAAPSSLPVALAFENAGTSRTIELDDDGKRRLLAELSYWLDRPGSREGRDGFPDDARALYTALAGELHPPP